MASLTLNTQNNREIASSRRSVSRRLRVYLLYSDRTDDTLGSRAPAFGAAIVVFLECAWDGRNHHPPPLQC